MAATPGPLYSRPQQGLYLLTHSQATNAVAWKLHSSLSLSLYIYIYISSLATVNFRQLLCHLLSAHLLIRVVVSLHGRTRVTDSVCLRGSTERNNNTGGETRGKRRSATRPGRQGLDSRKPRKGRSTICDLNVKKYLSPSLPGHPSTF